jgi:hypothetical protein
MKISDAAFLARFPADKILIFREILILGSAGRDYEPV